MARAFNYIYAKLVRHENDMVGHIAYSLYKKEKIAFISDWKLKNPGKEIPEDVIETFNTSASTEDYIKNHRTLANQILQKFCTNLWAAKVDEVEKKCREQQIEDLKQIIAPINTPRWKQYMHGSLQSVIGAFIFAVILALCSLVNFFHSYDVKFSITPTTVNELSSDSTRVNQ